MVAAVSVASVLLSDLVACGAYRPYGVSSRDVRLKRSRCLGFLSVYQMFSPSIPAHRLKVVACSVCCSVFDSGDLCFI